MTEWLVFILRACYVTVVPRVQEWRLLQWIQQWTDKDSDIFSGHVPTGIGCWGWRCNPQIIFGRNSPLLMQKELNVRPVAEIQNSNDIVGILIKKKWRENGLKQHHKSYQKFTRNTHAHTRTHTHTRLQTYKSCISSSRTAQNTIAYKPPANHKCGFINNSHNITSTASLPAADTLQLVCITL